MTGPASGTNVRRAHNDTIEMSALSPSVLYQFANRLRAHVWNLTKKRSRYQVGQRPRNRVGNGAAWVPCMFPAGRRAVRNRPSAGSCETGPCFPG